MRHPISGYKLAVAYIVIWAIIMLALVFIREPEASEPDEPTEPTSSIHREREDQ